MPRIEPANVEGNLYARVLARQPEILEKFMALDVSLRFGGLLPAELKEEVRRSTAEQVGCRFCSSLAAPKDQHIDRRESLAVGLAQMIAQDPSSVDDKMFEVLREDFSDDEILELLCWICLVVIGGQMLGNTLGLEEASPEDMQTYSQWREETIAATASGGE